MNAGLAITFVIGGIFLISILRFNTQVMNSSQEIALNTINQDRMDEIVELITNDFTKIGFNASTSVPFSVIKDKQVRFEADVFDTDNFGATDITWYFDTSDPVSSSTNPSDYYLKRTGPIDVSTSGTLEFPVVYFEINYYTADGSVTTNTSTVKKIEVEIMIETPEPYNINAGDQEYPRIVWKRIFVPNNINLPY